MWQQICTYTWLSQMRSCFLTRLKVFWVCKLQILSMSNFWFFRLLVGAPEADAGQRGVVRGGAVYKCRPDSPGQCDLIQFDKEGQWQFFLIWFCWWHLLMYFSTYLYFCAYVFFMSAYFKPLVRELVKAQSSHSLFAWAMWSHSIW